jgi:hypothetical protein
MTHTNSISQKPKCLKLGKYIEDINLIIHGQGVIIFDASSNCALTFLNSNNAPGLRVYFTDSEVNVYMEPSNKPLIDKENTKGILVDVKGAYYWFSLDSQNQRLYAGIGEARQENIIYSYQFPEENRENTKIFLESLVKVNAYKLQVTNVLRDPITKKIPLLVKNSDDLTMDTIALGSYIPKSNLSIMSQKLYDCIAGKQFTINTPDFPEFTKAIEYSIDTPGNWCYERLKQKATEFDKDKPNYNETYLRITLGGNNGESPGIPYVMEIWPVGHYSPIHNHGGSSAIIRVLNGSINVSLFPFLSGDYTTPFAVANFEKDDITWISPTLNQVHQLKNLDTNKDTCITIQCYMYETDDNKHYDYFDYLDGSGYQHPFEPNSDMDFIEFKKIIKREWCEKCLCNKCCITN